MYCDRLALCFDEPLEQAVMLEDNAAIRSLSRAAAEPRTPLQQIISFHFPARVAACRQMLCYLALQRAYESGSHIRQLIVQHWIGLGGRI